MSSGLRKRKSIVEQSDGFLDTLKNFDAYAKPHDDFRVRTASGATVTFISAIIIFFLISSEFLDWNTVQLNPSLVVDRGRREKMQIHLNITFPHLPCYLLTIDVMDVSGDHQNDIDHSIYKVRIDQNGRVVQKSKSTVGDVKNEVKKNETEVAACGDCYGGQLPPSGCCNTCEDVRKAYEAKHWSLTNMEEVVQCVREGMVTNMKEQENEGCNLHGHVEVNKVAGNFHFAPGKSFQQQNLHIHDLLQYVQHPKFDFTHNIHTMSFGKSIGFQNPLDGSGKVATQNYFMFQYFVKVVGTEFNFMNGTKAQTNQFSVTENERDVSPQVGSGGGIPGVFFNYEISPMLVVYKEYQKPFAHFLTDVCAIVGGIFTVASMLDGFIYNAEKSLKKKLDLGKGH
ncbi:hypothetical protein HDU92_008612 [Lobulomyces angularis]|nr:hypothetical protein HDU92_008612 [Lobulomyces angularis]